jgi:uncharacterized RDD family membrane protein YckC
MKAFLIDWFVIVVVFVVAALIGGNVSDAGAPAFLAWLGFWLFYDPLMVALTGGTIGHQLQNLRVVADRTGGSPPLWLAFLRNLVKSLFGIWSLLAMAGSRRQKTLHDWIARTTVQVRDPRIARLRDFTRVELPPAG